MANQGPKTIATINFKGGVGKTTVARRIYQIYNDDTQYEAAYLPMPIFPSEFQFLNPIVRLWGLSSMVKRETAQIVI